MLLFHNRNVINSLILLNLLAIFLSITADNSTKRAKSFYEYDFSAARGQRSEFTARMDQDAIDLYKEYKDSIYVDRYYNASFAVDIPLFTVTLPGRGRGTHSQNSITTFNIGKRAMSQRPDHWCFCWIAYSIVLAGLILLGIALYAPVIFPESRRSLERAMNIKSLNNFMTDQMDDFSEHVFGRKLDLHEKDSIIEKLEKQFSVLSTNIIHSLHASIEELPHFPGKRFQECVKWCICDAHRRPKKYGYIGRLFRSIFPHKSVAEATQQTKSDRKDSKVLSHYRLPAKHGRDQTVSCDDKYDGCSISIVEVIQELNILTTNAFKTKDRDKTFFHKLLDYYFDIWFNFWFRIKLFIATDFSLPIQVWLKFIGTKAQKEWVFEVI